MRWSRLYTAAILFGVFCQPRFGNAQAVNSPNRSDSSAVRAASKKKSPTGAMLRSLAVPGWGQFYNGKYVNAALVFGAEVGLLAAASYWNQKADTARGDNQLFYQNYRNTTIGWLAGTVLLSAADAFVEARYSNRVSLKEKKNSRSAILRSLAFPGWGQFYNRKYSKAFLFFGFETGLIATSIHWNQKAVAAHGDIRTSYQDNRKTIHWWLLATVVLSMLDAYVDASLSDFDESPDLSLAPSARAVGRSKEIMLTIKIRL
jgi:TM2 domain-containing membrane protein YozV